MLASVPPASGLPLPPDGYAGFPLFAGEVWGEGRRPTGAPAGGARGCGGRVVSGRTGHGCAHTPAQPASWGEALCSARLVRAAPALPLPWLREPFLPHPGSSRCQVPPPGGRCIPQCAAGGGFDRPGGKLSHRDLGLMKRQQEAFQLDVKKDTPSGRKSKGSVRGACSISLPKSLRKAGGTPTELSAAGGPQSCSPEEFDPEPGC